MTILSLYWQCRQFWLKIVMFDNSDPPSKFSTVLTKNIDFFDNFNPKSTFFIFVTKYWYFQKIWPKTKIFDDYNPMLTFSTILTKNKDFPTFWPKIDILYNFLPIINIFGKFNTKPTFLPEFKLLIYVGPKLTFSTILTQNQQFWEFWP